ncbi:MAG TPA: xanthine dehydrogenase family protein molybdopterin-binding subunit [Thermoanaerobaculia bacterium]|nr:xanthine dehydrogenase family protein molybdopterin-binding subunit [Thermoanaerobaculia bacterium]
MIAEETPNPTSTRKERFLEGVAPSSTVERTIPQDEPPPWPANAELRAVGKPAPRQDGRAKTTGAARYPSDVQLPGMLYADFAASPFPHARVLSIDTAAAERVPGVRAVHVLDKILGSAELVDPTKEVASKYPIVRYAGQPVAAVAATTPEAAREAARKIRVDYEELPFVVDLDEARAEGAPLVFPAAAEQAGSEGGGGGPSGVAQKGNVRGPMLGRDATPETKAAVQKAFAACDAVVAGTFRTQVQTHSALETHGVVADWKDDGLTLYASTQSTLSVRDELATIFDLPKAKVRVLTEFMGGGFGAKFGAGTHGLVAATLSKKAGAPVHLFYDRKGEHLATGNRPDSLQTIRLGATKDGKLRALELSTFGTAGVGTGAGTAGPAQALYRIPAIWTEEHDVFTHAGPGAAFRAPGHPQGCFALEQAIDELAEKLGLDVLELMDRNDDHPARRAERKLGAERIGWAGRRPPGAAAAGNGAVKRGLGVAQSVWYRINSMESGCEVRISQDGSVEALSAVQDIGGGIKTAIAQVVAEELGLAPADVTVRIGDTSYPPGPPSGGSMTTSSITPAVRNAAYRAKLKFLEGIAAGLGVPVASLELSGGQVRVKTTPERALSFRQAAAKLPSEAVSAQAMRSPEYGAREMDFLGGVQFAAVAVDTETGVVRVERVVAVHDCGRPMNPLAIESQVNGGVLQGISFALYENRRLDRATGRMVNPNLEQYKILGAMETPEIEVHLVENYLARSSTDAGGIGEPATIPTAAAIANAIHNAIGVRMRELPITPARVLAALGKVPEAGPAKAALETPAKAQGTGVAR